MDAPPSAEDCSPFVNVSALLSSSGLHVPKIYHHDVDQGFMVLEDLGDTTYMDRLTSDNCIALYRDAIDALVCMQQIDTDRLPHYSRRLLRQEMQLFADWLMDRHLGQPLESDQGQQWQAITEVLIDSAMSQPGVFVHRDYHSRNLMHLSADNPGIIDFQDAVHGPISYDVVSLLRDCYVSWPRTTVDQLTGYFVDSTLKHRDDISHQTFTTWFDLMGIQRHLKASGIFCRLHHRDGKSGYLNDIPRTLRYIVQVGRNYPSMSWLVGLIDNDVLPAFQADAADTVA